MQGGGGSGGTQVNSAGWGVRWDTGEQCRMRSGGTQVNSAGWGVRWDTGEQCRVGVGAGV